VKTKVPVKQKFTVEKGVVKVIAEEQSGQEFRSGKIYINGEFGCDFKKASVQKIKEYAEKFLKLSKPERQSLSLS